MFFVVICHAKAIVRIHLVYRMSLERRQAAGDSHLKPTYLACRLLLTTPTITIYYYYSAQKLIIIVPFHRG